MGKNNQNTEIEQPDRNEEPKGFAEIDSELDRVFYTVGAINELIEVAENLDQFFDDNPKCEKIRKMMENKIENLVKSL
jgi:hypothetical protein